MRDPNVVKKINLAIVQQNWTAMYIGVKNVGSNVRSKNQRKISPISQQRAAQQRLGVKKKHKHNQQKITPISPQKNNEKSLDRRNNVPSEQLHRWPPLGDRRRMETAAIAGKKKKPQNNCLHRWPQQPTTPISPQKTNEKSRHKKPTKNHSDRRNNISLYCIDGLL